MPERPLLTLAHSPDPDDAFMWWPITGKIAPPARLDQARGREGATPCVFAPPVLGTGPFRYAAVARDIEHLNRLAVGDPVTAWWTSNSPPPGDVSAAPEWRGTHDITALSARTYADAADRYAVTRCGGSFGDGYGPKVVCREGSAWQDEGSLRGARGLTIAVPGSRTTAFLVLSLLMGRTFEFVEMPFARIIGAVAAGEVGAGLIIHEGQLAFGDAGLRQIVDLGAWWKQRTGLPLPLGVNAIRRDLDERFGPGSVAEVAATLTASVRYASEHRAESIEYARTFAMANLRREHAAGRTAAADRARVERYIDLYVTPLTLDMGDAGIAALRRLFAEGAASGLCPSAPVEAV